MYYYYYSISPVYFFLYFFLYPFVLIKKSYFLFNLLWTICQQHHYNPIPLYLQYYYYYYQFTLCISIVLYVQYMYVLYVCIVLYATTFRPPKNISGKIGFSTLESNKNADNGCLKRQWFCRNFDAILLFYCAYGVFFFHRSCESKKNASQTQHGCIFDAFLLRCQCISMGRCWTNMHQKCSQQDF